jgi:hypothetical protein
MRTTLLAFLLCATCAWADGDGLFWSARLTGGQVEFYRFPVATPGAAYWRDSATPIKYLKITVAGVEYMTAGERADVDAAIAAAAAAAAEAAAIAASNAAVAQAVAYTNYLENCKTNSRTMDMSLVWPTNRGPLVVGSNGKAYQLVVDDPAKQWLAVKRIDGTYLSDDEFYAVATQALAEAYQSRTNIALIQNDLATVTNATAQINVSASSPYATNITATTGATKTAFQNTRTILVDMMTAINNLEQAVSKLRREVK